MPLWVSLTHVSAKRFISITLQMKRKKKFDQLIIHPINIRNSQSIISDFCCFTCSEKQISLSRKQPLQLNLRQRSSSLYKCVHIKGQFASAHSQAQPSPKTTAASKPPPSTRAVRVSPINISHLLPRDSKKRAFQLSHLSFYLWPHSINNLLTHDSFTERGNLLTLKRTEKERAPSRVK